MLSSLHSYIQKASDSGLITRQELVSMLPPLYLDVKSSDIILDMCAAPGSKTSQLL
jgi:16S rRNA C967 or C1407 C5-methylase (RsmB/RsmF family)